MYFNLAASNGHPGAAPRRDEVQAQMTPEALIRAQQKAREWSPNTMETVSGAAKKKGGWFNRDK